MHNSDSYLEKILARNREAYDALSCAYQQTSKSRFENARWLDSTLSRIFAMEMGAKILEIGSADGAISGYLSQMGYDVTAIDFSQEMINYGERSFPLVTFVHDEFLSHNFEGETFDFILMLSFIHLFPPKTDTQVMKKAQILLKPEGQLHLSTTLHEDHRGFALRPKSMGDLHVFRYRQGYSLKSLAELISESDLKVLDYHMQLDWRDSKRVWIDLLLKKKG